MKFTGERVVPDDMHHDVSNYQRHLYRYVFSLGFAVRRRTLDAACGAGYGSAMLSTVASEVKGLDVSAEAVDYAREKFPPALYPNLSYDQADLDATDLGEETWETVVSFETIEHLKDPPAFLARVRRALVPGGFLVASLPTNSPSEYHLHVYDDRQARELIEGSGLALGLFLGQYELNLVQVQGSAPYLVFVAQK